jgi:pimeloyl-ACP methyl ester carboxylesterase
MWDDGRERLTADSAVARRPSGRSDAPLVSYPEAALEAAPSSKFAIVAHSSGGVVGAEVARLVPSRVTAFPAISAVIPTPRAASPSDSVETGPSGSSQATYRCFRSRRRQPMQLTGS